MADFAPPVIVRLVRNCALERTIQYAGTYQFIEEASDYWMPRLREA
jgi:hypothetical protein